MKLVTMSITLALVAIGYGAGFYSGHYQGRDQVQTAMMDSMGSMGMSQMGARR